MNREEWVLLHWWRREWLQFEIAKSASHTMADWRQWLRVDLVDPSPSLLLVRSIFFFKLSDLYKERIHYRNWWEGKREKAISKIRVPFRPCSSSNILLSDPIVSPRRFFTTPKNENSYYPLHWPTWSIPSIIMASYFVNVIDPPSDCLLFFNACSALM